MNVDFTQLATWAVAFFVPAALSIAYALGSVILQYLKKNPLAALFISEDLVRKTLQDCIQWGVGYATQKVKENNLQVKFDNQFIAQVVQYVTEHVPDALAYFKITPSALEAMVKARLGLTDPANVVPVGTAIVAK